MLVRAPEPLPAQTARTWTTSPAVTGAVALHPCRPAAGRRRRSRRPGPRTPRWAGRPGPPGRGWRSGPGPRRPAGAGPPAWSSRGRRAARAASRCSSRTMRSSGDGRPLRSSRQVPPASGGPGQATLSPMPATTAGGVAENSASARIPASLAVAHQQVVGPFELCLDPGHLGAGIEGGQAQGARAQVQVVGVAVGAQEHRGQQVGARRRLPAPIEAPAPRRLVVGHRHQPLGIPLAGPLEQVRVGGVDLAEPTDLPFPCPHGTDHTARAIVRAHERRKGPACSRRS